MLDGLLTVFEQACNRMVIAPAVSGILLMARHRLVIEQIEKIRCHAVPPRKHDLPLFFWVRLISRSISAIFSRIPISKPRMSDHRLKRKTSRNFASERRRIFTVPESNVVLQARPFCQSPLDAEPPTIVHALPSSYSSTGNRP